MNSERLPFDPGTGEPRTPSKEPGYYPGYDVLSQQEYWDEATRRKVLERVLDTPEIRFFSPTEAQLMEVIASHLLPQHDRDPSCQIPIVPRIDQRLHEGQIPGYRFEKMPPDRDAYRLGFRAIEQMATKCHGRPFLDLSWREQDELLKSIHDAKPMDGAADIWERMEIHRFWALMMGDCAHAYYSHPWAWNEIGFGGPAYPRAYMRLENGEPEPWEVAERRYEWRAPKDAVSDPSEKEIAAHSEHPASGQGGTH